MACCTKDKESLGRVSQKTARSHPDDPTTLRPVSIGQLPASWVVSGTMAVEVKEALTLPVE